MLVDLAAQVADAALQPLGLGLAPLAPRLPLAPLLGQAVLGLLQLPRPAAQLGLLVGVPLLPLRLRPVERRPGVAQLPPAQLRLAVKAQPGRRQRRPLGLQVAPPLGQQPLAVAQARLRRLPVGGVALLEAPVQLGQVAALLAQLRQAGLDLAAAAQQLLGRLGDALRVVGPVVAQGLARLADLFLQLDELAAALLQVGGQLRLLAFEGDAAVLEAGLLLGQGRLLRRHRGRLDAQGVLLALQGRPVGGEGVGRRRGGRGGVHFRGVLEGAREGASSCIDRTDGRS
jgi:hypothetical protein